MKDSVITVSNSTNPYINNISSTKSTVELFAKSGLATNASLYRLQTFIYKYTVLEEGATLSMYIYGSAENICVYKV